VKQAIHYRKEVSTEDVQEGNEDPEQQLSC
jgi:hypothetical protein